MNIRDIITGQLSCDENGFITDEEGYMHIDLQFFEGLNWTKEEHEKQLILSKFIVRAINDQLKRVDRANKLRKIIEDKTGA